jgi:hypothetical protein
MTEEQKLHISIAQKEAGKRPESKAKRRKSQILAQARPEVKENNRQKHLGKKASDKTKKKHSESTKIIWTRPEVRNAIVTALSDKNNYRATAINCYTLDGVFIKQYDTITEAASTYDVGHITNVCKGPRKHAGGFIWRYATDCDPITHVPNKPFPTKFRRCSLCGSREHHKNRCPNKT